MRVVIIGLGAGSCPRTLNTQSTTLLGWLTASWGRAEFLQKAPISAADSWGFESLCIAHGDASALKSKLSGNASSTSFTRAWLSSVTFTLVYKEEALSRVWSPLGKYTAPEDVNTLKRIKRTLSSTWTEESGTSTCECQLKVLGVLRVVRKPQVPHNRLKKQTTGTK